MTQHLINFAHANGFPAGSYKTFFNSFSDKHTFIAHEQFGHDAKYPWHNNWQHLVEELIHFVEKSVQEENDKVIAIGHSFGGVLSFIAACQRPDLFKGLIMLDPPVIVGSIAWLMRFVKKTSLIDKITPAGKAKIRRTQWPLESNLFSRFAKRKLFANFDERCLNDYVNSAIREYKSEHGHGLELSFSAEVEAGIFRNFPTNLSRFKKKLTVPATLVYAQNSDVCPHYIFKRFAKQNNMNIQMFKGAGHMFPLERPEQTVEIIENIIKSWQSDTC